MSPNGQGFFCGNTQLECVPHILEKMYNYGVCMGVGVGVSVSVIVNVTCCSYVYSTGASLTYQDVNIIRSSHTFVTLLLSKHTFT